MIDGTTDTRHDRETHVPNAYDVSMERRETGIDLLILNNHKNVSEIDAEVWSHMCVVPSLFVPFRFWLLWFFSQTMWQNNVLTMKRLIYLNSRSIMWRSENRLRKPREMFSRKGEKDLNRKRVKVGSRSNMWQIREILTTFGPLGDTLKQINLSPHYRRIIPKRVMALVS